MVTVSLCVTDDDRRQVWGPVVCLWGSDPSLQHQRSQTDPEDHPDLARHEGGRGRWWRYSLVSPSRHIQDELEHGRRNLSSEARSAESWEAMDLGQQQLDGGFPERIDGKASRPSPVATRSGRTLIRLELRGCCPFQTQAEAAVENDRKLSACRHSASLIFSAVWSSGVPERRARSGFLLPAGAFGTNFHRIEKRILPNGFRAFCRVKTSRKNRIVPRSGPLSWQQQNI